MFEFESSVEWQFRVSKFSGEGVEREARQYHIQLLCDAGYLVAFKDGIAEAGVFRMTSLGHDFLDAVRDDSIWNKTKEGAASIGGATLGIVKDIAVAYLKQAAGERLGLNLP